MRKTFLVCGILIISALVVTGCSPGTVNVQASSQNSAPAKQEASAAITVATETPRGDSFKIERKDSVSIPGIQGSMKFGGNMGMRFEDNKTLPEMWQFDHALSEQNSGNNKALTVALKATNISGKLNSPYHLILVSVIFYDQTGKEIIKESTCVKTTGKIDLKAEYQAGIQPGTVLIMEPFFWLPINRLNKVTSYVIEINAIAKCYEGDAQEYFPLGSLPRTNKTGVYKEIDSAKGRIIVGYKTNSSENGVMIAVEASADVLTGARLRFNWLDGSGKIVATDIKEDLYREIYERDRRYLSTKEQIINYTFEVKAPSEDEQKIRYYEFWIETNK